MSILSDKGALVVGMHSEQKRILQAMTPEQKLQMAFRLYRSAWQLKAAALREFNPHFSEKEIQSRVKEAFLYARA